MGQGIAPEAPKPTTKELLAKRQAEDAAATSAVASSSPPGDLARHLDETRRDSAMPAVAVSEGSRPVKTIEHYTFADGEDSVNFAVSFDKDLWAGAAKCIEEAQVHVDIKATSLEIRIVDVPLSADAADTLVDWRLNLAPLFSRVEPLMSKHRLRNGKLTVTLAKTRAGAWKKGVK